MAKQRKPRTKSYDIHFDGAHFNGQPYRDTPATDKLNHRYTNNLCLGCGQKECKCKNK
jgi:hypothetical protein